MSKLAGPFLYENSLCDEFCEFNIKFDKDKNDFTKLIEFVNEYRSKRINIKMRTLDVSILSKLAKFHNNLYVRLEWRSCHESVMRELKEHGIGFFFDSDFPASDMVSLCNLISFGVSDVYIGDALMYNLPDVSEFCRSKGVRLRVVLNGISTFWGQGRSPKDMFFRPEDYDIFNQYFDIFEFDCDKDKINVMKKVWLDDRKWKGNLQDVNYELRFAVPNGSLSPWFTQSKITCGRKCDYVPSYTCTKCQQFMDLANAMAEKGFGYR